MTLRSAAVRSGLAVVLVRATELLLCRGMDDVWWVDDAVVLELATALLRCHGRDTG
jgi:hypothetical protein